MNTTSREWCFVHLRPEAEESPAKDETYFALQSTGLGASSRLLSEPEPEIAPTGTADHSTTLAGPPKNETLQPQCTEAS